MSPRSDALQLFIDSAFEAFDHFAQAPQSRRSILQISSALEVPGVEGAATEAACRCVPTLSRRSPSKRNTSRCDV